MTHPNFCQLLPPPDINNECSLTSFPAVYITTWAQNSYLLNTGCTFHCDYKDKSSLVGAGADPVEVKSVNFHPTFQSPLLSFFLISQIFKEYFISLMPFFCYMKKMHPPPFQNPGSAPEVLIRL